MNSISLTADDGAKLSIDGTMVIDHDGLHSPTEKIGAVPLAKGHHRIKVEWFNKTGGSALDVKIGKIGEALKPLGLDQLFR